MYQNQIIYLYAFKHVNAENSFCSELLHLLEKLPVKFFNVNNFMI